MEFVAHDVIYNVLNLKLILLAEKCKGHDPDE